MSSKNFCTKLKIENYNMTGYKLDYVVLQVTFEYSATQLDIVESFWRFTIPEQNINIPFLLVGQAKEPDIIMDRSHMNFKALLIGNVGLFHIPSWFKIVVSSKEFSLSMGFFSIKVSLTRLYIILSVSLPQNFYMNYDTCFWLLSYLFFDHIKKENIYTKRFLYLT